MINTFIFVHSLPTTYQDNSITTVTIFSSQIPENVCGVFHWTSNEKMTKYLMSIAMASAFSLDTKNIIPDKNPSKGAPRPYDTHLSCEKMETLVSGRRTLFSDGIKSVLEPYVKK